MKNLAFKAMLFARHIHKDQVRKYTGNPYSDHLAEVAAIVASSIGNIDYEAPPLAMIATAWLHDCIEDHGVPESELVYHFGATVAKGVMLLSDMETGNRAQRKRASCNRLAMAPAWVQSIKCADLISNMASINKWDPEFAVTFKFEKSALLEAMTKADPALRQMAMGSLAPAKEQLSSIILPGARNAQTHHAN
jgi:guanosine-3',5'-bis(diphosphate) 3'-pyrophosphohydrolase